LVELAEDGYAGFEIRDSPAKTEIIIRSTKTQQILGERGRRIRELTVVLENRFTFPSGRIELFAERVLHRGLNALVQAISLEFKIKCGLEIRKAATGVVRFVMDSGAVGCEVVISGKLKGERARAARFSEGLLFHSGNAARTYIDKATRHCCLRAGVLGLRVKINLPHDPTGKKGPKTFKDDQVIITKPRLELPLPRSFTYTQFAPLPPGWVPSKATGDAAEKNKKTKKKENTDNSKTETEKPSE